MELIDPEPGWLADVRQRLDEMTPEERYDAARRYCQARLIDGDIAVLAESFDLSDGQLRQARDYLARRYGGQR
jgi:hypothetical protein